MNQLLRLLSMPRVAARPLHMAAVLSLVGLLPSCQTSVGETSNAYAASKRTVEAATPLGSMSTTAELPDSLRLTPLALLPGVPDSLHQQIQALHASLGPNAAELRLEVLERACVGYLNLRKKGRVSKPGVLAVADMDMPSSAKRLWVLDLKAGKVLQRSHVAHGEGSGYLRARRFSNVMRSECTALGFYRTQDTYQGKHGLSRRLRGLDVGQNDNALHRYVVLHAADYVSKRYIERHGQVGYSRGCPALPPDQYRAIINAVGEGAVCMWVGPA
ncbi:murein L,D-transpeptidase catalytic domain family protein [Hymenobacter sp. 5414T-23]|uniref:murein L,D-transpeptidase catalytic domain family protein n=1 Tax=Hymenobacter sp. 5414T-23 TaxID=2932252 RepID=UPI001FD47602|nr:murein L,D-transpeptidase catalytic domain family protein [Hymenobacter sp. 5414T-23]UOQ79970.1 murein L,D-transpeptidase catalytic domain family protein [Hymenobacter sp. 5414T-23]